ARRSYTVDGELSPRPTPITESGPEPVSSRQNQGDESPDPDADDAAQDPTIVTKAHCESFQAWMIETRSASTALNKHKGLQQFFKYLLEEEEIDKSPMARVKQPIVEQKLVPIMGDDDTKKLLDSTKGKTFLALRDEAIIRLYYNTGARLCEIGNLKLTDLDMNTESVLLHGKAPRTAGSDSGRRPLGSSPAICGPARSGKAPPRCRSCGWPNAVRNPSRRTASRSC
ncbi:tyrosine-type recombinase/integrase, partial [Actinoplanes sp. GCM10030250]|uniref:tyrosine-type recombinase/integrase n=1 Tax=Actinoplanes sp. GCM10030250 TaxID=3273376 RepID=UPI003621CFF8